MSEERKQLTVGDVLKVLKTMDQDTPVWAEGCDCIREVLKVAVIADDRNSYKGHVLMYTDGDYGNQMLGLKDNP